MRICNRVAHGPRYLCAVNLQEMAHEHHHEEEEESPRGRILRIGAAALLLAAAVFIEHRTDWSTWQYLLLYLACI